MLETTWKNYLNVEFEKTYFRELNNFLNSERKSNSDAVFPPENSVFAAYNSCDFEKIKVVILGQDPYPTKGHAMGLSFSVQKEVRPLPKSLKNIFSELQDDLGIEPCSHGDLSHWAQQGVFLLNSVLTVRAGEPNSHQRKGWEQFTKRTIELLNDRTDPCVFLLWGKNAHQLGEYITNPIHLKLKSSHPSPLGWTKSGVDFESFRGCKHFSKTNTFLRQHALQAIEWKIPD